MRYLVTSLLLLFPLPLLAETPMSAEAFDRYTRGKTLFFSSLGERYGVEEYLPDRRVRWSFLDGQCKEGIWYPQGNQICFVYEDTPDPHCWVFFEKPRGLSAQFVGGDNPTELYEIEDGGEMLCLGPEVGV